MKIPILSAILITPLVFVTITSIWAKSFGGTKEDMKLAVIAGIITIMAIYGILLAW